MSVDYTRTPKGEMPEETESAMFAPAPIWDRSKKNREARRSMFQDEPIVEEAAVVDAAVSGRATKRVIRDETLTTTEDGAPLMATTRTTTVRRDRNVAPAAVAVGLVALAALAAAGWYATRPAEKTLTPGDTAPTAIAATPSPSDAALAANTPPANPVAATPSTTTTTTHHVATQTARTEAPVVRRSTTTVARAPARSAATSGVNTGATTSVGVTPSAPVTAAPPPAATAPTPAPAEPTTQAPAPATTTPDVTPPATATTPATPPTSTPPQ
jgi:hypothetical protein